MMMTTTQMPWFAWFTDEAIAVYQRYVSPRKGFRCAHRALHGRSSCSQYARRVLQRRGPGGLAPLLLRRFKRCGKAAKLMRERRVLGYERQKRPDAQPAEKREQQKGDGVSNCADGCDVMPVEYASVSCDPGDIASLPCDAGSVDACPCDGCDFTP